MLVAANSHAVALMANFIAWREEERNFLPSRGIRVT